MKKLLLLLLLVAPLHAATKAEQATKIRTELHHLWNSSAAWLREYLIDLTHELSDKDLAAQQLLTTHEKLANLLEPLYGKEKAKELTILLKKQGTLTITLIKALKDTDEKTVNTAIKDWKTNACAISTFFSCTNPYISYQELYQHLLTYLSTIQTMVRDRLAKKWAEDAHDYDALRAQLHKISSLIGNALTDAFPEKPVKGTPAKPKVTVSLPPGTSLRKAA